MLVIGIDAATWEIIDDNLDRLPTFKRLKETADARTLELDQKPWSASCWASMFSGTTTEEHGHTDFVEDGELQTREDIPVDFVWDHLEHDHDVRAINVPMTVPPYSFNVGFEPPAQGAPTEQHEMDKEIEQVTETLKSELADRPDLLIGCYVSLDKLQHFHWGEDVIIDYYEKVDAALGEVLEGLEDEDELIIISDHGFTDKEDAAVRTLPDETPRGEIKGEHSKHSILITRNVDGEIKTLRDVADVIEETVRE